MTQAAQPLQRSETKIEKMPPERVMAPDEIAVEVLKLCDGQRSVADITDHLAAIYTAPREEIAGDIIAMLQDLADSGFLVEAVKP